MARKEREERRERQRAGSGRRDAMHRAGGDWNTITIPTGVEMFLPKAGNARFDVVPYEVGEGNPYASPGEWYYERTYYIHRGVGPNNESFVCPLKTAKKPCPICEYRSTLAKDPDSDEKLVKDLKPKQRQLFLIRLHSKDGEPKLMLYESSFHTFGELLDKMRTGADEDEPHKTDFDDDAAGATLKVSYADKDVGAYSFVDTFAIEFKPRPRGLDSEVLEHGICLDKLIKVPTYDALKRAFLQEPGDEPDEDEDEEKPKREKLKPRPAKAPPTAGYKIGDTVRHTEFGDCTVEKVSGDGTSLVLEDEEGEVHRAVDSSDVRRIGTEKPKAQTPKPDDDDDDDEPAPPPKKSPPKKAPAKSAPKEDPEEDDEGEWDKDWDEDEAAKAPPKEGKKKPPVDDEDDDEPVPPLKKAPPKKGKSKPAADEDDNWDD